MTEPREPEAVELSPEEATELLKKKPPPEVRIEGGTEVRVVAPPGVLRLYRCFACLNENGRELGRDFAAPPDAVRCPNCGITPAHPRLGGQLVVVSVIHYEPPVEHPNPRVRFAIGSGSVACAPGEDAADRLRSAERRAVTCPHCKRSEAFRRVDAGALDPRFDVPVKSVDGGVRFENLPADAEAPAPQSEGEPETTHHTKKRKG